MRRVLGPTALTASTALVVGLAVTLGVTSAAGAVSPVGAQSPAPTTPPAAATTLAPTTIPQGCTAPLPVALRFVGTMVASTTAGVVRFNITQVRDGAAPGNLVDIDYSANDDARFLKDGKNYLVTTASDPESNRLISKVRQPREEPAVCAPLDPVYTRHADGSPIDTSLLAGMRGRWGEVATAFLIPAGAVFAVLLGLVILKHTLLVTGRGVGWGIRRARDRRQSKPSPPADRPRRAAVRRRGSRTRTHTGSPAAR
jgi:hypothetical protein